MTVFLRYLFCSLGLFFLLIWLYSVPYYPNASFLFRCFKVDLALHQPLVFHVNFRVNMRNLLKVFKLKLN